MANLLTLEFGEFPSLAVATEPLHEENGVQALSSRFHVNEPYTTEEADPGGGGAERPAYGQMLPRWNIGGRQP
jgi:hypothetical protein